MTGFESGRGRPVSLKMVTWYPGLTRMQMSMRNTAQQWLATPTGAGLLQEEARQVRRALDSLFGDQFLQIGHWGCEVFRDFARTQRTSVLCELGCQNSDCIVAPDQLAVIGDSVDVVLLPHVLETSHDPHAVLREVDRILRPDGHVVILGFNPVSFWGLRHLASRREFPQGVRRMISEHRLCDWLRLLNFTVRQANFYHFQAPIMRRAARDAESASTTAAESRQPEPLLRLWQWPPFAGCYLLLARKQLYTVTPIRPVWKRRRRLVGGLVNPTTRNAA